jgi:hypothetical protein
MNTERRPHLPIRIHIERDNLALSHDQLGQLELFLVPIRPDEHG